MAARNGYDADGPDPPAGGPAKVGRAGAPAGRRPARARGLGRRRSAADLGRLGRRSRYARLRQSIGRHPADLARMAVAAGVVLGCVVVALRPGVNPVESAIFDQVEALPNWSSGVWSVVAWYGSWPGIVLTAGLALYLGRLRLGAALCGSAVLSWVLALVIQWLAGPRPVPPALFEVTSRLPGPPGFEFPAVELAVAAALATSAGPYVTRWVRNTAWVAVVLVAVADVFLGRNLPLGVFAGAVLGWGAGTFFHLTLGAPGRRTSDAAVLLALRQCGIEDAHVTPVPRPFLRPQLYDVATRSGEQLQMKVVRRLHRLAGPAYRVRRLLASLDVQHEPDLTTPRHEVEHEAYVTLLAERAGVRTLPILLAGEIEHGPPFLIRRHVAGHPLSQLTPSAISDSLLDELWHDVLALRAARITHHDLRAKNIVVDERGHPRIADFTFSRVGGPGAQSSQDAAEMLVSVASVVGVPRAVESAVRALPADLLREALPDLQWLALHTHLRRQLRDGRGSLADLREALAERIGEPLPGFRSPVRPATLAVLLAGGLAVYLLLPQISSLSRVVGSFATADWRWLLLAAVLGQLTTLAAALTMIASSRKPVPWLKTTAVQVAATFTGRTTAAGVGFYGINLVYLERLGLRRANAVGVLLINRAVMGLVSAVLTVLGILVIGDAVPVGQVRVPNGWPLWLGVGLAGLAAVAIMASPFGRARLLRPGLRAARDVGADLLPTLRHPARATALVGGSVAFLVLSALGLVATLLAFQSSFPLLAVMAVFIVGSTLGQLAPTPGGLGAVEGALVAGLTAIGIGPTEAVAAVLASRLLTFWLPVLPGIVAFRLLQHQGVV
ncbi:MAG TPA: flippase-like domain-containing protein [Nocardioidaceae bacterium]|nr:flippase-like domain-containing protein [Nocardioidaceae bacterium]